MNRQIKANLNYLRIAPRKVRLVANLLKGLSVVEAENQLKFLSKRPAGPLLKLLKSAVANATHNFKINKDDLFIAKITVDAGPMLKRWLPRAMGRATPIQKKTSHVALVLEEKRGIGKQIKKKKPEEIFPSPSSIDQPVIKEEKKILPEQEIKKQPPKVFKAAPKKEKISLAKKTLGIGKKIFRRKAI